MRFITLEAGGVKTIIKMNNNQCTLKYYDLKRLLKACGVNYTIKGKRERTKVNQKHDG